MKTGQPLVALSARFNEATDENVRADLAALPGILQRIDDWIAEGVLGGEQLNAADLQIATSVRLLMTLQDLREDDRRAPRRASWRCGSRRTTRVTPRRSCRRRGWSRSGPGRRRKPPRQ